MSSSSSSMSGMSITPTKNSTYSIQTKILNVNTKLEINPFYSGFNTFKVTFTDANGRPNTKVNAVEMTFINTAANMGPIVANLQKTGARSIFSYWSLHKPTRRMGHSTGCSKSSRFGSEL